MSRLIATVFFSLLFAVPAASSTGSEFSEIDQAAELLAKRLASPVPHIVEIAALTKPDGSPSKQGEYLSLTLGPILQFHGKGSLIVRDHTEFEELLANEKVALSDFNSIGTLKRLASLTGADILLVGTLEREPNDFVFRISVLHAPDAAVLEILSGHVPATKFLESLDQPFPPILASPIYRVGVNGASFPVCQYMPDPQYNDYARMMHIQGTIVIEAVLSPEGRVMAVHPVKMLGAGLDEESVRTLLEWRCKPATKSDGTPVYARTSVEFTFRVNFSKP